MAQALAILGMHEQRGFVATLCTAAQTKLSDVNAQQFANMAWALAILGV